MTSASRPSEIVAVMYVPTGWRRRSVGDPGLSTRSPLDATESHGMWLCPKTSTSVSGKSRAHRASRPAAAQDTTAATSALSRAAGQSTSLRG